MAKFAMLGLGYISNRHIEAIAATNNELIWAYDPSSTHNIANFPNCTFYTEPSEAKQHLYKADWVSICSPSYLHFKQIKSALLSGCDVIVEKPICLTVDELNQIQTLEQETGKSVFSIFQLRYHPAVQSFTVKNNNNVSILYQGKRGDAYYNSWKGNVAQSGGIVNAVGIHYFDLLTKYYGMFKHISEIKKHSLRASAGILQLDNAIVDWNFEFFPEDTDVQLQRNFLINGELIDFSSYSSKLHIQAYQAILNGKGVSTTEANASLEIVEAIMNG